MACKKRLSKAGQSPAIRASNMGIWVTAGGRITVTSTPPLVGSTGKTKVKKRMTASAIKKGGDANPMMYNVLLILSGSFPTNLAASRPLTRPITTVKIKEKNISCRV